MVETVNDASYERKVARSSGFVVVDHYADWCGPCQALAPVFERLSDEFNDKITFFKVNVDEASMTAQKNNVRSIPCLIFFKNGKEIDRVVGGLSEEALREKIEEVITG